MNGDARPTKPKGINTVKRTLADGTVRVYHYDRKSGQPIDGEPGTPEFDASLRRARRAGRPRRGKMKAPESAWKIIAKAYQESPEYKALVPKTRQDRDRMIGEIIDKFEFQTVGDLGKRRVREDFYNWRNEMADTPAKADKMMGLLSLLLQFAYDRGTVDVNHAARIKRLTGHGTRKDIIVTADQEAKLLAAASPHLGRAMRFAMLTAMRQGDMCRITRDQVRDGWLHYTPSKTAKSTAAQVWLPVFALPPLKELIDELLALPDCGTLLPWDGERGYRALEPGNIDFQWRKLRDKVLGPQTDLHWHDQRGTAITRLFEAECTDAEVSSISGHAGRSETSLRDYQARTKKLALSAFTKLARSMAQPVVGNVVALAR
ncbi:tyrosine-type recombinase/integrase [Azospirillum sp.]|uniref:tyrosine-type recombinase/integrase n=1 Tax=Azospirillum sp. TaxID=34012 RepID=UPI003D70FF56